MTTLSVQPVRRMIVGALVLLSAGMPAWVQASVAEKAAEILDASGVRGGLVVHLTCGDGTLTAALRAGKGYLVQGLATSREELARARAAIHAQGTYGPVSVRLLGGARLPYGDDLVNLVVADKPHDVPIDEIMRVLRPGGVFCRRQGEQWVKTVKPWPADIDQWDHHLHDAGNNPVARDARVGPPRRLQWKAGPLWSRSHEHTSSLCAMVSAEGRIFYVIDEGLTGITQPPFSERWVLVARDAFNGVLLWKRPLPDWRGARWKNRALRARPESVPRRLVAGGGRLYVTPSVADPVLALEAATGRQLTLLAGTERAEEIVHVDGALVVRLAGTASRRGQGEPGAFAAVDLGTGRVRWRVDEGLYAPGTLAANAQRIVYCTRDHIVCRRLTDGDELWRVADGKRRMTLILHGGKVIHGTGKRILVLAAEDGRKLWTQATGGRAMLGHDVFVARGHVWHADGHVIAGYDLATGKPTQRVDPTEVHTPGHHLRCYRAKATERYLITQNRGAEFVSIAGEPHVQNDWIRGACRFGVMPCNGLLYVPPHPCFCYPGVKLSGFNALAAGTDGGEKARGTGKDGARLYRGEAYDAAARSGDDVSDSDDWPMYRHDARRSGSASCKVGADVSLRWEARFGGRLTPPVVSGGRAYVAAKDSHTLYAVDAERGKVVWHYTAGGRIDSPPTVWEGRVLFGCADGCVTCLRASDGRLAWQFRAAPSRRQIIAFDQLESPWRVHGSVLIDEDVAYCTAGRSSFLDGGIRLVGLDPATGKLLHETYVDTYSRTRQDAERKPFVPAYHMEGALSDILVAQGGAIYLGQYKFDRSLRRQEVPYVRPGQTGEAMQVRGKAYTAPDAEPKDDYEKHQRDWLVRTQKDLIRSLEAEHGGWSLGRREMGLHLITPWGFLDSSWFNRTYWTYATTWPGYYIAHRGAKTGQLVTVGPDKTYAVQVFTSRNLQSPLFRADKGYLLFADDHETEPSLDAKTQGTTKGWGFTRSKPPAWFAWLPIRVRAMVLAGQTLFVAGPPDPATSDDPTAALTGRRGAMVLAVDAGTGKTLSRCRLDGGPVFDGLAAAAGRLYLVTQDGRLMCLEAEKASAMRD